jgi:general secretion pathway protein D
LTPDLAVGRATEGAIVRRRLVSLVCVSLIALTLGACSAGRLYRRGYDAARAEDWDAAVSYYTKAVQADPERAEYKIALERAMQNASFVHLGRARELEAQDQLDAALLEYKRASEYDPANRQAAAKAVELERAIRDRIEATRPQPPIVAMRERARQSAAEPILNPASREPLNIRFTNASLRDILSFISGASGINVTYDPGVQDRPYSVQLDGVTLEQALQQILTANSLFYKVLNERTITVIPETPANRAKYEEQVIRTFFLSHADATELAQIVNTVIRSPGMAVQPLIAPNKTANTITVRATAPVAAIIERLIETNDKPRAEILIDVEILEVNRTRAKAFGLNLTQYAIGGVFSPEVRPGPPPGDDDAARDLGTRPDQVDSPPLINLNTLTRGVSAADFYLAVPAAVVRFLESDSQTKLIAKPQLRGAEGSKLTLNLGDEIPVPTTAFTPIAGGGANVNPLTSFNYRPVGVNVEMTPRVTVEGDIILDLILESSTLGEDVEVAGVTAPSFGSRKVTTRLRLRDGESNLLAGLLREDERRLVRGFPGAINVPILRQLFSGNDTAIAQTDIVMLLTPRIVRTHELSQRDLNPIYIGTQQNLGLSGPPPLIAPPAEGTAPPEGGAAPPAPEGPPTAPSSTPPTAMPTFPPSSPTPGTINQPGAIPGAPPPSPPPPAPVAPAPETPAPRPDAAGVAPAPPAPGAAASQILVTPPGGEFRVAGGPYTVPISITGASRVSTVSVTLMFNQAALRVRSVQEGSFMRQGGTAVTFTQQVDASIGRIDITMARTGDATGASGSGLLAAILFDAIGPGPSPLSLNGVATSADGAVVPVQFVPASVVVR